MQLGLDSRAAWVFDMDGTLTEAMHDFEALRLALGLPADQPILEALTKLPPEEAAPKRALLEELELELAAQARVAEGAVELLEALLRRSRPFGILTRNSRRNVEVTLGASGLAHYFEETFVVTRDDGPPKPHPRGLEVLFARWQVEPQRGVMVGDYLYDLQAGRAAGCLAVYVDASREFRYREEADLTFGSLLEMIEHL